MIPLSSRILLALLILLTDAIVFVIPLGALLLAYVLIARPPWVKEWVDRLYG